MMKVRCKSFHSLTVLPGTLLCERAVNRQASLIIPFAILSSGQICTLKLRAASIVLSGDCRAFEGMHVYEGVGEREI